MVTMSELFDHFESVDYLYLRGISEPDNQASNTLAIFAEEAVVNREGIVPARTESPELDSLLQGAP